MSVKIQIDRWVKIKICQRFPNFPHKVSLQGKNFEGKFSRQKIAAENFICPRHSETHFEAEKSKFRCKINF